MASLFDCPGEHPQMVKAANSLWRLGIRIISILLVIIASLVRSLIHSIAVLYMYSSDIYVHAFEAIHIALITKYHHVSSIDCADGDRSLRSRPGMVKRGPRLR